MPMLGTDSSSPNRRAASAYPPVAGHNWSNIIGVIVLILLVRNVFFHDYRREEIEWLTAHGKSTDEIKAYIPLSKQERREESRQVKKEMEQLLIDVARLKKEVRSLEKKFEERDGYESSNRYQQEDEGKSFDKLRFQEEEDEGKPSEKRQLGGEAIDKTQESHGGPPLEESKTKGNESLGSTEEKVEHVDSRVMPTKEELDRLGSAPEGDLLG